ncbi:T9SS sorting signal type C domain-containing protein [Flavobacterium defluvii]|uniref:Delta-60 repeat domain-containing protein n=1 Tax=Flavobacterium defluvii TaxID=370979 RepID=A0A1M5L7K7_9FLAO|nr:T9SS sorting signal type C domain-containing protein [Flavobacterium defluvii]SHG61094.1 delta-60 repeat domain-containing protein [Flavobacterium defluvii]
MIKKLLYTLTFLVSFYNQALFAQQGKVDITFNTIDDGQKGDGFNSIVRTLFLQPDNNLIVGGDYTSLNGIPCPHLTRLLPDGTIDESFNTGTGFVGNVYSSNVQPDGKILVGGSFTSYNGTNAGRIIRLNHDGTQDLTFNTSIGAQTGIIHDIALQSDGKIIIVGTITKYNNTTINRIARLLPNGSLDSSFLIGTGASVSITNVKVLPDDKILLTGNFELFNNIPSKRIIRLNADGSVDSSFNTGTGFDNNVNAIEIQPDGKILLGGSFTSYNEVTANRIVRLNPDGTRDFSFLGSGFSNNVVQVIKTDSSGNIMIGGSFTGKYEGSDAPRLIFLNPDGTPKTNFDLDAGPAATVWALANDAEGSWFIGGTFSVFDGQNQGRLAKVNFEGEADTGYLASGIGFDNSVFKIIALQNKKAMVFGSFTKFNDNPAFRIARLLEDGSFDNEFNSGGKSANNIIKTAVLQSDGKMILGGNFTSYNEQLYNRIVRIFPDGSIDNTFNAGSGFNGQINSMVLQSDGKIIIAGSFTRFNNDSSVIRIVRLMPDGSRDLSFNPGTGTEAAIEEMLIQPDGKILVGGRFTTFNGRDFLHLVRLNTDGSIDTSFNIKEGFDKNVYSLALQSDGKIIVGGSFLTYNKVSQKRILRLNSDGSLDTGFDSGIGFNKGEVRSILVQPDDRLLVGGSFSGTYKNKTSLRLIRLLKTGDYDPSFDAGLNNKLFALSITADHKLLIGGNFNSVSGISKHRICRLKLCLESTTWNGLSWSNGYPSGGKETFFKESFPNLISSNVCSCTIDEGKKVTLLSGNTLGIEFSYTGLGTLILEDSASLYQYDDDIVNTGGIQVKRKTKPVLKFDYTYWSSPVQNQTLFNLSPNTLSDKYLSYNSINNGWIIEDPQTNMIQGKGYAVRAPQEFSAADRSVYETTFTGIPNNGKIEINLEAPNRPHLIGNPYPSAIDADAFLIKNEFKTKGALYFWTHNTPLTNSQYTSDDYAVYNLVGGVGTKAISNGINETIPDGKIASGQGFFIKSNQVGTLEFDGSMRISNPNNIFYKPHQKENKTFLDKVEKHRLWLNLKNDKGAFKQILIGYLNGATNSYDLNYDAEIFNGNQYVDFYSINDSRKLAIQGRALPFQDSDQIILGYKTVIADSFTISVDHTDGDLINQTIYLEDKLLNNISDLTSKDYNFNSEIGTFTDRFVLHFSNKNLTVDDFLKIKEEILISSKNKIITVKSTKQNLKNVLVYDINGKLLLEKTKLNTPEFIISNLTASHQILLLKITLEDDSSAAQKVIF